MPSIAKKVASFSLSLEAIRLLIKLAQARGLNKSATLESIIREDARRLGVE